ncbi:MAG: hypothetical protein R2932_15225 [Caldilineaceae bacterium]
MPPTPTPAATHVATATPSPMPTMSPAAPVTPTPISTASSTPVITPAVTPTASGNGVLVPTPTSSATATVTPIVEQTAPAIQQQPRDMIVHAGEAAVFTIIATDTVPLQYQWYRNGTAIAGATAATYTMPEVTAADHQAAFHCVVTSAAAQTASRVVTLSIWEKFDRELLYYSYLPHVTQRGR